MLMGLKIVIGRLEVFPLAFLTGIASVPPNQRSMIVKHANLCTNVDVRKIVTPIYGNCESFITNSGKVSKIRRLLTLGSS